MADLLGALGAEDPAALLAVARAGSRWVWQSRRRPAWWMSGAVVLGGHFAVLDQWLRGPLLESLASTRPGHFPPTRHHRPP